MSFKDPARRQEITVHVILNLRFKVNKDGQFEEKPDTKEKKRNVVGHRKKLKPGIVRAKELAYYMFDKQRYRCV